MVPETVQHDLAAAETSAGVAALAHHLLGDAAAATCAVLAVVNAVSNAPSFVPPPSDRADGTDFASGLRPASVGGLPGGAAEAAARPAAPRLSEDGAAAALAAAGFFATAAQARAALGAAAAAPAATAVRALFAVDEPPASAKRVTLRTLPVPVQLPLKHTALVCIDFQRDFLDQGGFGAALGNDVNLARTCLPAAATLLEAARESGLVIVHTKEGHAQDLSDCPPTKRNGLRAPPHGLRIGDEAGLGKLLVEGSAANDFVPEAAPLEGEIVLRKPGKGAFFCTDLHERLRALKVTHLVVCGVTTEVCVQTTIREANDRGYECVLVEDATASYFPHFKRATIEMMRSQGGIAGYTLAKADDFAAALRGDDAVEPPPQTPPTAPPKAVVAAPARLERAVRRHGASVAAACLATGLAAALARRRPSAHAISLIGAAFAAGALSARYFASMAAEREVRAMAALAVREALPGADKGDVNIQCDYDRLFGMCQHDTAVVCIDLQTDFVDSANGRLAKQYDPNKLEAVSEAVANAARLLAAARKAGLTVAHSRSHRYGTSIRRDLVGVGDAGYELFPAVAAMPGEIVVDKWTFGAFASTQLEAELRARGVRRILLCGVLTNVCVFSTAIQAVDRFFRVCLVEDACASFERDWHEAALMLINEPQRAAGHAQKGNSATGLYFGEISSVDRVQAALKSLP